MTNTSKEDREKAEELFKLFDRDNNGVVTEKELTKGLRSVFPSSLTEKEIDEIYQEMGVVRGKPIGREKFIDTMTRYIQDSNKKSKTPEEQEKEYRQAFNVFDRDGNGTVNRKELTTALKNIGEKMSDDEIKQMFEAADVDKDGKIQYEEFVKVFLGGKVPKKVQSKKK